MTYRGPGPDPGPQWYGSPEIGWSDVSWEDAQAHHGGQTQTAPAQGDQYRQAVLNEFPSLAPFIDNPEVGPLLRQAVDPANNWTADYLNAKIRETSWWKNTQSLGQQWLLTSPADQEARIQKRAAQIYNMWQDYGGTDWLAQNPRYKQMFDHIDQAQGNELRYAAYLIETGQLPWEMFQTQTYTNFAADPNSALYVKDQNQRQQLAVARQQPQEIAEKLWMESRQDYLLKLDKANVRDWADKIVAGTSSYGQFYDYLRKEAATRYPVYADDINNGIKPGALADPLLGQAADDLGTSKEAIMSNDRLWGQIVNQMSGTSSMMNMAQWIQYIRGTPEFESGLKGQHLGLQAAGAFGKIFGTSAV